MLADDLSQVEALQILFWIGKGCGFCAALVLMCGVILTLPRNASAVKALPRLIEFERGFCDLVRAGPLS